MTISAPPKGGFLPQITPLLITYNEIANLPRTLAALAWARQVVVVDSGSTDGTRELLAADPRIRVLVRPFDDFARQWQAGLDLVTSPWVLALDADYQITPGLTAELLALLPAEDVYGFAVDFDYCSEGRALRGSLYPPRVVLHRVHGASYRMDGHTQRVDLPGRIERLAGRIRHDDRKPLSRWLDAQARYAQAEAGHLVSAKWRELGWADRVRRLVIVAPWLVPLHCLIFKRGLLDGRPGWHYALQRGIAEAVLSLKLIEAALDKDGPARKET